MVVPVGFDSMSSCPPIVSARRRIDASATRGRVGVDAVAVVGDRDLQTGLWDGGRGEVDTDVVGVGVPGGIGQGFGGDPVGGHRAILSCAGSPTYRQPVSSAKYRASVRGW